ncbi:YfaZ family outer membrane protein [Symbiopectobacterium purcellii]|uniref:YfaZ family outer membrane protein n=1 Tax=Symbiopectobacterium purcellii TaxID=2871826 RepID=UPI003F83C369
MKKIAIALAGSLLLATATAQAISLSGEAGDDYAGASAGFGLGVPGLGANVSYGHGKDNNDVYGFGLGYTLPLGAVSLTVAGKALYLNQQHATDGYGVALGGGLQFPINRYLSLYGEGYYAPDAFSSHIDHYVEAKGGVRWQVLRPLNLDLGYRYMNIGGESGRSDNKVADTFYLGAGFNF